MAEEKKDRYWAVSGYVRSGPNRLKVLRLLDRPQTPKELNRRASMNIKLVSRALREMADRGVVECKNPEAKRGRIYALTDLGELVLRDVQR